jgi:hypothetical protein
MFVEKLVVAEPVKNFTSFYRIQSFITVFTGAWQWILSLTSWIYFTSSPPPYIKFAWLIRRVLNLIIQFIGPLYNCLHQFTNHYLTHCHFIPTGHSTGTILTSNRTPLYSFNFDLKYKLKSHCDWQSVSKSWCRAPSETHDQIFITVFQLRSLFVGRPLWREDGSVFSICCWLLPASSISGSSPLGLATIFYSLRFETYLLAASYDSQGHGGGIQPRLHTGNDLNYDWVCPFITLRHGIHGKYRLLL